MEHVPSPSSDHCLFVPTRMELAGLGTQNDMTNKPEPAAWCPRQRDAIPRCDALRIRIPPPSVARRVMFNRDGPGRPEKKLLPPVPDLYPDAPRVLHLGGTVNMTNSWKKRLFHIAESGQLVDSQEERKLAATPGSAGLDQSVARLAAVASRGCVGSLDPRSRVTRPSPPLMRAQHNAGMSVSVACCVSRTLSSPPPRWRCGMFPPARRGASSRHK